MFTTFVGARHSLAFDAIFDGIYLFSHKTPKFNPMVVWEKQYNLCKLSGEKVDI